MEAAASRRTWFAIRAGRAGLALVISFALAACDRGPTEPERRVVPGQYIVVFKDHVQDVQGLARQIAERYEGEILNVYEPALKGFGIRLREPARLTIIRIGTHPDVAYVHPNYIISGAEQ